MFYNLFISMPRGQRPLARFLHCHIPRWRGGNSRIPFCSKYTATINVKCKIKNQKFKFKNPHLPIPKSPYSQIFTSTIMSSLRDFQRNLATFCYHNIIPNGISEFSYLHIFTILSPIAHHSSLIQKPASKSSALLQLSSPIPLYHSSPIANHLSLIAHHPSLIAHHPSLISPHTFPYNTSYNPHLSHYQAILGYLSTNL